MPAYTDLTGCVFGRWTVLRRGKRGRPERNRKKPRWLWRCLCRCGTVREITRTSLVSGGSTSCGCWNREQAARTSTTHGMSKTGAYKSWVNMNSRCRNPRDGSYARYGKRGITVCARWLAANNGAQNFITDMGPRPFGASLGRIDNRRGYSPKNCRWETVSEQQNNMRSNVVKRYKGETRTLSQWARHLHIPYHIVRYRARAGWSIQKIISRHKDDEKRLHPCRAGAK